jgi:hypothetical protein
MNDLVLRRDLLRRGLTEAELHRAVRSRELVRLRPGAFLAPADPRWADAAARHAALIDATVPQLAPGAVVSGISAAVLHGLPVWGTSLRTVHVTRDQRSGGRGGQWMRMHVAPLPPRDVVVVGGRPTTSVARTVVDVARTASLETAVTVADAALSAGAVDADDLARTLREADGRHGVGRARVALAFADAAAESPGESRSRVRMDLSGVAPPVLQHTVEDTVGEYVARVDFWWPREGVVGEFDGLEKYTRSLRAGERVGDALVREKRREDALRSIPGVRTVVRWTWADLEDFAPVAARLPKAAPT